MERFDFPRSRGALPLAAMVLMLATIDLAAAAVPTWAQDSPAGQLDQIQPILQKIEVSGKVNAQKPNQSVSVSVRVTDDLSGVVSFLIDFRSPSGSHHVSRLKEIPLPRTNIVADLTLGAYPFSDPPFLVFAEPGKWTVYSLTATDAAGNSRTYDEGQLNQIPGHHTFEVTNEAYDIKAPEFVSGTILTPTARLSKPPRGLPDGTPPYVGAEVSITDSGNRSHAGVRSASLFFCLAGSSSCEPGSTNTFAMRNVTNKAGLEATTLTIGTQLRADQVPGNYLIHTLELADAAGNSLTLRSNDFSGGNFNFHPGFPQGVAVFVNQ